MKVILSILIGIALLIAQPSLLFASDGDGNDTSDPAISVSSEPTAPERTPAALPKLLRLPSMGVEMAIEAVGATEDGEMGVPADPNAAGWYSYGTRPGDPGVAAIGGHVDWDGRARPFWYLRRLQEGDPVEVVSEDDQTYHFQIQWIRLYDVADAPLGEIFDGSGVSELNLITCGGTFDSVAREYLGRLVVRATSSDSLP